MKTKIYFVLLLSIVCTLGFAQNQQEEDALIRRHGLGISGGWGAPYGFGVEYSYLISPHFDVNVGAGFSYSGLRTGVGGRIHFIKNGSSPFIGTNFIYTTGLAGVEVTVDDRTGDYEVFSDSAIFLRGGYKIDASYRQILINVGYGFALDYQDPLFRGGIRTDTQQDIANLQALGGVEASVTIILRIGK